MATYILRSDHDPVCCWPTARGKVPCPSSRVDQCWSASSVSFVSVAKTRAAGSPSEQGAVRPPRRDYVARSSPAGRDPRDICGAPPAMSCLSRFRASHWPRLTWRCLALAAIVAASLLGERQAAAYPQWQLSTGTVRCNQCHYAPAGGGLLNNYGRDAVGEGPDAGAIIGKHQQDVVDPVALDCEIPVTMQP